MSALKICPQCGTEYELDQRFCPKDGSTLKTQGAAADLVGSIINKSYHVLRKLGEGGMGTVYLAEHVKMGRKSAVKVMNPGSVNDADAISRFNREAANASKISHPNVAAIYDFGETEDGLIFLAMEFIEGPSLTNVVKELGALPPARAADITRQASDALNVAHDMGIVHRDLKPDNIMLAKNRDGTDLVKVVDFGIAKVETNEAQKVTKTGLVVGTPEYMSPEQLAGEKLDGRSDTYSLALVAFNMLTGKLPFPGETVQESMIMRLTDRPKQLKDMKGDVNWSPQVQAVLDKALERDLKVRYQSASEFGRDLFKAVSGMRGSAATSMVGAMSLPPTSSPFAKKVSGASEHHADTMPIPATRVSTATPMDGTPAIPGPARRSTSKSRAPLFATLGVVGVLAAGTGAYYVMKNGNANATAAVPQGERVVADTSKLNRPITTPVVPRNIGRELEQLSSMVDSTPDVVSAALQRIQGLDSLAQASDDSTYLQFRYLRSKALINSGSERVGCDSLKKLQGRLAATRFKRSSEAVISACP